MSGHPRDEARKLARTLGDESRRDAVGILARAFLDLDAREEAERARAERAEAKLRAVAEREKFGQMTHLCRNENCGTISFGAGYKGKCPGCKQEGGPIPLSAREPGEEQS